MLMKIVGDRNAKKSIKFQRFVGYIGYNNWDWTLRSDIETIYIATMAGFKGLLNVISNGLTTEILQKI